MRTRRHEGLICGCRPAARRFERKGNSLGYLKSMALGLLLILGVFSAYLAINDPNGIGASDKQTTGSDKSNGPPITFRTPLSPSSIPRFLYVPILSDITTVSFTVSWVSDRPINASVEYCIYSAGVCDASDFPGSPSVAWDTVEFLQSGVALVRMKSLDPGTTFHYRAKAKDAANELNYSPNAAPYPSVTTKTSTQFKIGDPTFIIAPFQDKNGNYQWDNEPTDAKQYNFLFYLNHSGAEPLAARNQDPLGWTVSISTDNMRDATPSGAPHYLSPGNLVTFFIAGIFDDGSGTAIWTNRTASYTMPDPMESPVLLTKRTEKTVPELVLLSPIMVASVVTVLGLGASRWVKRFCSMNG